MKTALRLAKAAISVAATATLVAACDSNGPANEVTDTPQPSTAAPSNVPNQPVFATIKACDVLAPAIADTELGTPKETSLGGRNTCITADAKWGTGSLQLQDDQPFDVLPVDRGSMTETTIGGREARQLAGNGGEGNCQVSIKAGPNARALVALTQVWESTGKACENLKPIAEKVAAQLPAL